MIRRLAFALPFALMACADPQTRCISEATEELRIVQELIADTELSLARGYTIQTEERTIIYTNFCIGGSRNNVGLNLCNYPQPVISKKPVAIDPVAERRKLQTLRSREAQLKRQAEADIAACRLRFPSR